MTGVARSRFPDPRTGPGDAPLAWGGDLLPATLLDAYRHGIFPWPDDDQTLMWWSPDPRAEIPLDGLALSRSLRRLLRSGRLHCSVDAAFHAVVVACADRAEGTWILPGLVESYTALHDLGVAHSVEVWDEQEALVGGLYGVSIGGAFMGESMFHRASGASKVALVHLVEHLRSRGFALLDAQMPTPHLASLGAVAVPRDAFLDHLDAALALPITF